MQTVTLDDDGYTLDGRYRLIKMPDADDPMYWDVVSAETIVIDGEKEVENEH